MTLRQNQEGSKIVPEIMAKAKEKGVAPWHKYHRLAGVVVPFDGSHG